MGAQYHIASYTNCFEIAVDSAGSWQYFLSECYWRGDWWRDFIFKWSEVKWVTVKFLGTKVTCTLGWPYTDGTGLYCDCFIWCVSCTVVVLTCFVMCGCFGNMWTCIYCVLYRLYCYCIVSFMYIYSYLFCLYWCKDYCHRVTTQLQLIIIIIITIIIINLTRQSTHVSWTTARPLASLGQCTIHYTTRCKIQSPHKAHTFSASQQFLPLSEHDI